jgi:hypothetical protein
MTEKIKCCKRKATREKNIFTLKVFEIMPHGTLKFQIAFWALRPTSSKKFKLNEIKTMIESSFWNREQKQHWVLTQKWNSPLKPSLIIDTHKANHFLLPIFIVTTLIDFWETCIACMHACNQKGYITNNLCLELIDFLTHDLKERNYSLVYE